MYSEAEHNYHDEEDEYSMGNFLTIQYFVVEGIGRQVSRDRWRNKSQINITDIFYLLPSFDIILVTLVAFRILRLRLKFWHLETVSATLYATKDKKPKSSC